MAVQDSIRHPAAAVGVVNALDHQIGGGISGIWANARHHRLLADVAGYMGCSFGNHMGFLIGALDGDPSVVTPPVLPLSSAVNEALVLDAIEFLRRTSLPIEPRKKWPDGGMPQYGVKGFIAAGHQSQPGKALCVWGDAGWGGLVGAN